MNKRKSNGYSLTDYVIIGVLVTIVAIPALIALGGGISQVFSGADSSKDETAFVLTPVSGNTVMVTVDPAEPPEAGNLKNETLKQ